MEAARLSESPATTSQSARHHIPEDWNFHQHCCEILKSRVSTKNTHVKNGKRYNPCNSLQEKQTHKHTNTLCMKCKKKFAEGTDWVFLDKDGASIGVRNFWAKVEENNSLRLGVVWDWTLKISYNHKITYPGRHPHETSEYMRGVFCSVLLVQEIWSTAIRTEDKYRTAMQSVAKRVGLNSKQVTFPQALVFKTVTPGQRTERISRHTSGIEAVYSSRVGLL